MATIEPQFSTQQGSILPNTTFRWVKVNSAATGLDELVGKPYTYARGEGELDSSLDRELEQSKHGINEELSKKNKNLANFTNYLEVFEGDEIRVEVKLDDENDVLIDRQQIVAKEGQHGKVLMYIHASSDKKVERNARIFIKAEQDAILDLVLVHDYTDAEVNSSVSVVSSVDEGAEVNLSHIELAHKGNVLFNYSSDLTGFDAHTFVNSAYLASGEAKLDLFYNVLHVGQETISDIQANGALKDKSFKSFRGTLDFKKNCQGAKGNEEEFTILLSPKAKSVAVPLLLAHEDDVEGNHAASAGRIDEDKLFYIMSRGLSRKQAEALLVQARITPALDEIFDQDLRSQVSHKIFEGVML